MELNLCDRTQEDNKMNNYQEKINDALKLIEEGLENIKTNQDWIAYMQFVSRFYSYSTNNAILIYLQAPNASFVKGYKAWNSIGRYVKKGSKGIAIFAPCMKKVEVEDEDTGESTTLRKLSGYKITYVYDIANTEGSDELLPTLVKGLNGNGENEQRIYEKLLSLISQKHNVKEVEGTSSKGSFNLDTKEICIRTDLSYLQKTKTILHEFAHAQDFTLNPNEDVSRTHRELVAESVAFIVCNALGLDTSSYSFPYLNSWARTTEELKKVIDTIQKVAFNTITLLRDGGIMEECV